MQNRRATARCSDGVAVIVMPGSSLNWRAPISLNTSLYRECAAQAAMGCGRVLLDSFAEHFLRRERRMPK